MTSLKGSLQGLLAFIFDNPITIGVEPCDNNAPIRIPQNIGEQMTLPP